MAKGCLGILALIGLIPMIYLIIKIYLATAKEHSVINVPTTPLADLVKLRDSLAKKAQYLELKGRITCNSPVMTPFSGTPTPFYEFTVTQYWTIPSGDDDTDKNKVVHKSRECCPFKLTDKTETISVSIDPTLPQELDSEHEREFSEPQFIKDTPITYETLPLNASYISYEYTENYIPLDKKIYFIGDVSFDGEKFILKPGSKNSFITDRSEGSILKKTRIERSKNIRWFFLAAVVFILGAIGYIGQPESISDVLRTITEVIWDILEEA